MPFAGGKAELAGRNTSLFQTDFAKRAIIRSSVLAEYREKLRLVVIARRGGEFEPIPRPNGLDKVIQLPFSKRFGFEIVGYLDLLHSNLILEGTMFLDRDSLDVLLRDYACKAVGRHRSGVLYKATLPANLSSIEVSAVRLRSGSFWIRGANFSNFRMPPKIIPMPFVRRIAIVYQNLGNWSSHYYSLPGYSLISPVVGFLAYDAPNSSARWVRKLNLSVTGDPISIHFPQVSLPKGSNSTIRCVRFGAGGSVDFSKMTMPNVCYTRDQGHFSIVVPIKKKERQWKLWVVGFGCGFVGLVLVGLVGMVVFKFVKMKGIGEMERQADAGVAFETIWIGSSKMPSATLIRTQPVLENEQVP
ncbi:hypothetical protein HHK36_000116 [Tetracentron sinense]|uniref:Uncharacterized protein n=1 Tax=Tetracentron sinense TaxID=13715 RepID=A0A835DTG3_TETSI|nr:hypothetical protein HHK36_000116 [Tetracentron sinense]